MVENALATIAISLGLFFSGAISGFVAGYFVGDAKRRVKENHKRKTLLRLWDEDHGAVS